MRSAIPAGGARRAAARSSPAAPTWSRTGDKGYVSGDGRSQIAGRRPRRPRRARRARTSTVSRSTLADLRGKLVVVERVGVAVSAVPRRDADAGRRRRRSSRATAEFVGSTSATPAPEQARRSCGPRGRRTRPSTPRTARRCSRSPGTLPPAADPDHRGARPRGPGGRGDRRAELPSSSTAGRGRRRTSPRSPLTGQPMGEWFSEQAASGSLLLAIPVALVAGLVSFFSPCVIPLLPGYLSYATGLSGADLENAPPQPDGGRVGAVRARVHRRLRHPRHACPAPSAPG